MEQEILEGQRRLEEKRKLAKQERPAQPASVAHMLGTSLISQTSGDDGGCCDIHHGAPLPCEVCALQAAESQTLREKKRAEQITAAMGNIGLGRRHSAKAFADYLPTCPEAVKVKGRCQKYAATFTDRLAAGDSLMFLGKPGTGKNTLAACICNAIAAEGFTAVHTTALKLVRKIRSAWGKKDADEQAMIDAFCLPDLLVIDEVGVQFGTAAEKIQLAEVINERYEQQRPTILLSNLDVKGVESYLGEIVIDRFHEGHSAVFEFTWESYRRRK